MDEPASEVLFPGKDAQAGTRPSLDVRRVRAQEARRDGQLLPVQEIQKFGFKLTIYSATLMAFYQRMRDAMQELKTTGSIARGAEFGVFEEMTALLGVPEALALGKKYGS